MEAFVCTVQSCNCVFDTSWKIQPRWMEFMKSELPGG